MVESPKFDVFLCHNSKEKAEVEKIREQLKQKGIYAWLDKYDFEPFRRWQDQLEEIISQIEAVAVFLGSSGVGPWADIEMREFLVEFAERQIRMGLVILPGCPNELINTVPRFMKSFHWVDFRQSEPDPMEQLIWGITGIKPPPSSSLQVFEFDVVTVEVQQSREVQRSGLFGLKEEVKISSNLMLNRSHSQARYFTENLGNNITLNMVAIPGGKFLMGTEDEEIERLCKKYNREWFRREKAQHEVTVQSFFMGKYPVTQAQWKAIASREDLKVECDLQPDPSNFKGDERPVEKVSWEDAVEFCARLSKLTGNKYRLPSEAEWEYACRAGTTTPFHFGETITTDLANYDGNYTYANEPKGEYRKHTISVGSFPPNAFGLYDMHGNVWEWCEDDLHNNYEGAPTDGSAWLSGASNRKVIRGGSWDFNPSYCRSAYRNDSARDDRFDPIGFRVVCVAPRTT